MCKYICIYSVRGTLYTFFSSDISPEMKAFKVLTYHLVLLMLQWPTYQIQVPILEMWSKSSLMSASTPKRNSLCEVDGQTLSEKRKKKQIIFLRSCRSSWRELGRGLRSPDPQTRALATWQSPISLSDPRKSPEVIFIFNLVLKFCKKGLWKKLSTWQTICVMDFFGKILVLLWAASKADTRWSFWFIHLWESEEFGQVRMGLPRWLCLHARMNEAGTFCWV